MRLVHLYTIKGTAKLLTQDNSRYIKSFFAFFSRYLLEIVTSGAPPPPCGWNAFCTVIKANSSVVAIFMLLPHLWCLKCKTKIYFIYNFQWGYESVAYFPQYSAFKNFVQNCMSVCLLTVVAHGRLAWPWTTLHV